MRLQAGVASDRGLVRPVNEDSFFLRDGLYAVCDGMGGARGGEVASQMACLGLLGLNPVSAGRHDLREAVTNANRAIIHRSTGEHHLMGMGTTLTALLVGDGKLTLAHVGDSRAYLLRQGDLTQLTEDHSWVGEMVRRGDLTPAQAAIHPHRSVITRALGTDDNIEADLFEVPVTVGDRFMICSDGLTGMVPDTDLVELLEQGYDAQATAEALVKAALAGGGEDNVTVVVVDVLADEEAKSGETKETGAFSGQILFGPSDRGAMVTASSHRAGRAGAAVRERLGRRTLPSLRPVGGRGTADQPLDDDWPPVAEAAPVEDSFAMGSAPDASTSDTATAEPAVSPAAESAPVAEAAPEPGIEAAPAAAPGTKPGKKRRLRGRRGKWLFFTLAVVLIIALAVAGFAIYNSSVYYVGTYADGTVALYRGLPNTVLGVELSHAIQLGTVKYDALTPLEQQQIDSHELVGKEDGQMLLQSLVTPPVPQL